MKSFLLFISLMLISIKSFAILTVTTLDMRPETCGNGNGSIVISVSGGLPPYTYLWSNGSTIPNPTGLSMGQYTVTVTDASGDTGSALVAVSNSPTILNADLTFQVPGNPNLATLPCNSQCNGTAYLTEAAIIGTPPYMLSIIQGNPNLQVIGAAGVAAITNICTGDQFTAHVTDATGCPANNPITAASSFVSPSSFSYVETITPSCFGGANGSVKLKFIDNNYGEPVAVSCPGLPTLTTQDSVVFNNLLPGVYTMQLSYPTFLNPCDTTIQVTIPDLGSNCGVVSGKVYLDTITNCIVDINEPGVPNQVVMFSPGPFFATCDSVGNYSAKLPFNTYTATAVAHPPLYSTCSVNGLVLNPANDTILNVDLGDSVNITTDITVGIISSAFRPGFQGVLYSTLRNLSIDLIAYPQIDIYYDPQLVFASSTVPPTGNVPGHLTFIRSALNAFSYELIPVFFNIPASIPIGTPFNFVVTASANVPEPDLSNNTDSLLVLVTGAFDPNDKAVQNSRDSLNSYFTDIDNEIEYRIRFQNTGNDTAFTVVVIDTLSTDLDPSTFRLISTSHPVQYELSGQRTLKFTFNNILLPDSNVNEPASHGAILFSIEPYVPVLASTIENRADIYFDFNPAVLTNTVSSTVTTSVGVAQINNRSKIILAPNPATNTVSVVLPGKDAIKSVQIINTLGREVFRQAFYTMTPEQVLNISTLPSGIYIVKTEDDQGKYMNSSLVIHR